MQGSCRTGSSRRLKPSLSLSLSQYFSWLSKHMFVLSLSLSFSLSLSYCLAGRSVATLAQGGNHRNVFYGGRPTALRTRDLGVGHLSQIEVAESPLSSSLSLRAGYFPRGPPLYPLLYLPPPAPPAALTVVGALWRNCSGSSPPDHSASLRW